jgi:hypothetical protein
VGLGQLLPSYCLHREWQQLAAGLGCSPIRRSLPCALSHATQLLPEPARTCTTASQQQTHGAPAEQLTDSIFVVWCSSNVVNRPSSCWHVDANSESRQGARTGSAPCPYSRKCCIRIRCACCFANMQRRNGCCPRCIFMQLLLPDLHAQCSSSLYGCV